MSSVQSGLYQPRRSIYLGYNTCLVVQELFALLSIIRSHLAVPVTITAQHFGIAHLLTFYGAVDFLFQSVCPHHVPGAAAFSGIPQGLQFKESFILQIACFIEDDKRGFHRTEVIYQVFIHVRILSLLSTPNSAAILRTSFNLVFTCEQSI